MPKIIATATHTNALLIALTSLALSVVVGLPIVACHGGRGEACPAPPPAAVDLDPSSPLTRELGSGEEHEHFLHLEEGQAFHAVVEQRGIDVVVELLDPRCRVVAAVDSPNGERGVEELYAVAEVGGRHRLRLRPFGAGARGRYRLSLDPPGPASPDDRWSSEAQRALRAATASAGERSAAGRERRRRQLERALELWSRTENTYQQALTHLALGDLANEASRYREAAESYAAADGLLRSHPGNGVLGGVLNSSSDVHLHLDEVGIAYERAREALRLARQEGNELGEATALHNLGAYYRTLDDLHGATSHFLRALELWRRLGDEAGTAATLRSLGELATWTGRFADSRSYLEQALGLDRSPLGRARTLTQLGWLRHVEGDSQAARRRLEEALALYRAVGDGRGEAVVLDRLGTVFLELDLIEAARTSYRQAADKLEAFPDLYQSRLTSRFNHGWLLLKLGRHGEALARFESARERFRARGDLSGEAHAHFGIAQAWRALGRTPAALESFETALEKVEEIRATSLSYGLRSSFFALRLDYFEATVAFLMELDRREPGRGHAERAFEISERARARSLLEMLAEARSLSLERADPELLERKRRLEERLYLLALELEGEAAPPAEDLRRRRGRLAAELDLLYGEIRAAGAGPQRVGSYGAEPPKPLAAAEIRALLDPETLILAFSLGEEHSHLWLVDESSIEGFRLSPRREIESVAEPLAQLLRERLPRFRRPSLALHLEKLGRMLFADVAGRLGGKRLVMVADGVLHRLPLGILPAPAELDTGGVPPPLLARHEILSLPSASVLETLRRRRASRRGGGASVVLFADPAYSIRDRRYFPASRQEVSISGSSFSDLPPLAGSRIEAERVLELHDPTSSRLFVGFEASRQRFLATDFSGVRRLHLAVHAQAADHEMLSRIVFSRYDPEGRPIAGDVFLYEIYGLELPVEMAVLSACETGAGVEVEGEGVVGLQRAFLYAGAASVVTSLWQAHDAATAELMARFYRELELERASPPAALRRAQLWLREQPGRDEPYYWAGFQYLGDW